MLVNGKVYCCCYYYCLWLFVIIQLCTAAVITYVTVNEDKSWLKLDRRNMLLSAGLF